MSYDTTLGRWVQMDPIGYPDGLNAYEMEKSNPVALIDPSGLDATVYDHVFLVEMVVDAKILDNKTSVEFTVRGSYWNVKCECEDRNKVPDDENPGTRALTFRVKRGRNTTAANVVQYVKEAVLPSLPAWHFGGSTPECLAAVSPNSFYPIFDDPYDWTPGKPLAPRTYKSPTTKPTTQPAR